MHHKFYFVSLLLLLNCSTNLVAQSCQLNPPTNLTVTNLTTCSAVFNWQSAVSATFFVSYKLSTSATWSANINAGSNTSYTFTGLQAGKKYNFRVFSKCTDGSRSAKEKKSATLLTCMLPTSFSVAVAGGNSATISVTSSCSFDSLHVRYKTPTSAYTYKNFSGAGTFVIDGLHFDSTYIFSVTTCPVANNNWTSGFTITLPHLPNIIFILIDDSQYNLFSCNGAPSWFHSPNIDRIANEGVNFKNTFCVSSLCAPSRAVFATGLHTVHTGVLLNGVHLDTSFVTVPEVLGKNGYYTTLVGKNHGTFLQDETHPEFDFWLWCLGNEDEANNIKNYDYNGVSKVIDKDFMLTITDTAVAIINRVNNPLFMWLAYKVPHLPANPLPWNKGIYNGYPIPFGPDTAKYKVNYPSSTYVSSSQQAHGIGLDTNYRKILEVITGLDSCIGVIINALESTGKLDNTLLIFTNDNGYMLGNHYLLGKTVAYEPSMRLPLFVRYPAWFQAGSIQTNSLALNTDIAPTIYQAAGITANLPAMDGVSLKTQFDGGLTRNSFYYFMFHEVAATLPTVRCVRDKYFKYVYHNCLCDTVEELFDMVNDPLELTNLVNNHNYASTLIAYENKLDSFKLAINDTITATIKPCYISNPSPLREELEDDVLPTQPIINPDLNTGVVEIFIPWQSADVILYDELGRFISAWKIADQFSTIDLPVLSGGAYFLKISGGGTSVTKKLIVPFR